MSLGRNRRTWLSAALALFMVFVLPMCWFGALTRAKALNIPGPSSSNNNEEREEHEQSEVTIRDAQGVRPPLEAPVSAARDSIVRVEALAPRELVSVAVPEPSVLSVRRLL